MHYRNGKEAKNGDKIVQFGANGEVTAVGVLHSAQPGNDYCNGYLAPTQHPVSTACLVDCITVEDLAEIVKNAGLGSRPEGK